MSGIDGNGFLTSDRVLEFTTTGTLTISGLTIRGGQSPGQNGGGISGRGGSTVKVIDATVSGNTAGGGGGIFATVTLTRSTVSGNTAQGGGGGISADTATLTNSTVSGNTARSGGGFVGAGGGIYAPRRSR